MDDFAEWQLIKKIWERKKPNSKTENNNYNNNKPTTAIIIMPDKQIIFIYHPNSSFNFHILGCVGKTMSLICGWSFFKLYLPIFISRRLELCEQTFLRLNTKQNKKKMIAINRQLNAKQTINFDNNECECVTSANGVFESILFKIWNSPTIQEHITQDLIRFVHHMPIPQQSPLRLCVQSLQTCALKVFIHNFHLKNVNVIWGLYVYTYRKLAYLFSDCK